LLGDDCSKVFCQILADNFQNLPFEKLDSSVNLLKFAFPNSFSVPASIIMDENFVCLLEKFQGSGFA